MVDLPAPGNFRHSNRIAIRQANRSDGKVVRKLSDRLNTIFQIIQHKSGEKNPRFNRDGDFFRLPGLIFPQPSKSCYEQKAKAIFLCSVPYGNGNINILHRRVQSSIYREQWLETFAHRTGIRHKKNRH